MTHRVHPARPLRIALFHDLPSGGAKRTVQAQVRELVERGHRVDAFVTTTAEESVFPLDGIAHSLTEIAVPPPPDRERLLAGRPGPGDLLAWLRLFRALPIIGRDVARQVDGAGYDLLLVHPSQFTQAPHVLRYSTTPTLYYCHEVLRAAYEPLIASPPVRLAIRLSLGRIDRRNARAATAIAANSAFTSRRVRDVYGRDSTVAAPAVDIDSFVPAPLSPHSYLLAVGALHPLKGLDFVVDAVSRIPSGLRPPLVLVSDRFRQAERQRIMDRARSSAVALEIRQRVGEPELRELYAGARAVLCAPHREPLGLVPLEAMASGTPVVAVAEGGIPETVLDGETGFLVPRDPDSFADRVRWLLEHPEEGKRMGRSGRRHVSGSWDWSQAVDRLEELIFETVAAR